MTNTEFWDRFNNVCANGDWELGVFATSWDLSDVDDAIWRFESPYVPDTTAEKISVLRRCFSQYVYGNAEAQMCRELLLDTVESFCDAKMAAIENGEVFDYEDWADY